MKLSEKIVSHLLNPRLRKNHVVDDKKLTITFPTLVDESKESTSLIGLFSADNLKHLKISENDLNHYIEYIQHYWLIRETDFNFENKAYNSAAYYCTQPDNLSRIKAIQERNSFDLRKESSNGSYYQLSDLAIGDILSFIILSQGLNLHDEKPVESFRLKLPPRKINKFLSNDNSHNEIQKLLEYLTNPKLKKSHHFDKDNGTIIFYSSTDTEEIISFESLFEPDNFKNLSINKDILDRYLDYIKNADDIKDGADDIKNFIIPEKPESNQKHPAFDYAKYFYSVNGTEMNKMLRYEDLQYDSYSRCQFTEIIKTNLNEINYSELEDRRKPLEIFIVIIMSTFEFPEIYFSQLDKEFCMENLLPLHNKVLIRKYQDKLSEVINKGPQFFDLLNQIKKLLENYFNITDDTIHVLKMSTIEYIVSTIILFVALNHTHDLDPEMSETETSSTESYRYVGYQGEAPLALKFQNSFDKDPAFLSFSRLSKFPGFSNFRYTSDIDYYLIYSKNNPSLFIGKYSKLPNESEILAPPDTPVVYQKLDKIENFIFFEANFNMSEKRFNPVNRPLEKVIRYCILYLKENIFNKPYADPHELNLELSHPSYPNLRVYKTNHDILHAVRQPEGLLSVLDFFAARAKNKDFREFCFQILNQEETLALGKMANSVQLFTWLYLLIISISIGRESEVPHSEDSKKYKKYRGKAVIRFNQLIIKIEQDIKFGIDKEILAIFNRVLENIGNPNYLEKLLKEPPSFELWVFQLANTSHMLDLPRCWNFDTLWKSLNEYLSPVLIEESFAQVQQLIDFWVFRLKLSGDYICNGYIVPSKDYDVEKFVLYSTSRIFKFLKLLRASPRPIFSVDEKETKRMVNEAMPKMVEYLCTGRIVQDLQLDKNQKPDILTDLSKLIEYMTKTTLPGSLIYKFLTILLTNVKNKSPDFFRNQSPGALVVATREPTISSELVRSLLESKISPNHNDKDGQTLLQLAMQSSGEEQLKKVQLLLELKADPNLKDLSKLIENLAKTTLPISLIHNFLTMLLTAVKDRSPDCFRNQSPGALVVAAREPTISSELVKSLLESKISFDHTDDHGQPLLQLTMQSSGEEQLKKTKLLLELKANPKYVNWDGLAKNARIARLIVDFYPDWKEFYQILLKLPLSTLHKINWSQTIENHTPFELIINLIPNVLDSGYLETLLHPAVISTLIWNKNLPDLLKTASKLLTKLQLESLQEIYSSENNPNLFYQYVNSLIITRLETIVDQTVPYFANQNIDSVVVKLLELSINSNKNNVNERDSYGFTGIMYAVVNNTTMPLLNTLIESGGNPWITDNQKKNALHHAAESKNNDAIAILIASKWDRSPILIWAVTENDIDLVKQLIDHHVDVNQKDCSLGATALMTAVELGFEEIVLLLLSAKGIDLNFTDDYGFTAVSYAVLKNQTPLLQILLNAGADPCIRERWGKNALDFAAETKNTKAIAIFNGWCRSPILIWAVTQNDVNLVKRLIIKCKINVDQIDQEGNTALMLAVNLGFEPIVKLLVDAGANPLLVNSSGKTALSYAQDTQGSKICGLLVKLQWQGLPLLVKAASDNNLILVQQLLAMGVDVNQTDDLKHSSALMIAASRDYFRIMDELLHANANVELTDDYHKTAMSYAVEFGQIFAVDHLESHSRRYALFGGISNTSASISLCTKLPENYIF